MSSICSSGLPQTPNLGKVGGRLCSILYFLLSLSPPLVSADEFFSDLQDKTTKGTASVRASVSETNQESLEKEVFEDWLRGSVHAARREQLSRLDRKIDRLDGALELPATLRNKYRAKQKHLIAYRRKVAAQFVDSQVKSPPPDLWRPSQNIENESENKLHHEARRMANSLPSSERKTFLLNWKASLVNSNARDLFATYIALAGLYGSKNSLVKRQNERMQGMREEFQKTETESQKIPKEEWSDWIYSVLNSHRNRFPTPLRARFKKISLLENQMILSDGKPTEVQLYQRKLAWEKELLVEILKHKGLDLDPEQPDPIEPEDKILEWFLINQNEIPFHWPLEEKGVLLEGFDQEQAPFVTLQSQKRHGLLAPHDGQVIQRDESGFSFQTAPYIFHFRGQFTLLIENKKPVKRGQKLAELLKEHSVEITLLDPNLGGEPLDLMTFF
jgi:hypothetical protein